MSKVDFDLAMYYLDNIEDALNKIALSVGHPTLKEWNDISSDIIGP